MAKLRAVDNLIGFITHFIQKFWQVFVLIFHMTLCSLVVLFFPSSTFFAQGHKEIAKYFIWMKDKKNSELECIMN